MNRGYQGYRNSIVPSIYGNYNQTVNSFDIGSFCQVPQRTQKINYNNHLMGNIHQNNFQSYPEYGSQFQINNSQNYMIPDISNKRIKTIAEEERQRILSLRRQEKEERERNKKLHEEHQRMIAIRREQTITTTSTQPRRNQRQRRNNSNLPVQAQEAQETALSQLERLVPNEWEEMLSEIQRPPPNQNENFVIRNINQNSHIELINQISVNNQTDENANKRQKLYDRNISSVKEMARHKSEDPCSVCFDDEPESMLIMVCCKQYFCFACISAWWKEKRTCPACRLTDPVFIEVGVKN